MKLQIHALRFCEDDEERAKKHPINRNPAVVDIKDGSEVVLTAKNNSVVIAIDGNPQMPISLSLWDYTAVCLVVDDIPRIQSVRFRDSAGHYGNKEAVAVMCDGSTDQFVVAWYDDELSFTEAEFVGLTIDEARNLKVAKDKRYLMS